MEGLSEWVFVSRADKLAIVSVTGERIAEIDIRPKLVPLSRLVPSLVSVEMAVVAPKDEEPYSL